MSDEFAKFLFLGVMMVVVLISSGGKITKQAPEITKVQLAATVHNEPPIFVLNQPEKERPQNTTTTKTRSTNEAVIRKNAPSSAFYETTLSGIGVFQENERVRTPKPNTQSAFTRFGEEKPPEVKAAAALVADIINGEKFFELHPEKRWPIASISKLISAAVVSKNFPMHESITMTQEDFFSGLLENGLKGGDKYSIKDLLEAMLIKSSNNAAEALARFIGRNQFVAAMNKLATEWDLEETHLDDPTGLSSANQSTIWDLFLIAKKTYEGHIEIFRITQKELSIITELNSQKKVIINNINLFAGKDYFLGGKTGYTDEAGGNLLSVFSYKDKPVVIIVLGTDNRFGETEKLFEWFRRSYQ